MKTMKIYPFIFAALSFLPLTALAQWQAVRFDSTNTFSKVVTLTTNTAFVMGTEPLKNECFLLRTNNGGATWDSIVVTNPGDTIYLLELAFIDNDNGFVGGIRNGKQYLSKTNDMGNTWTNVTPDPSSSIIIQSINFIDSQTGYAVAGTTLYKTIDGGISWTSDITSFTVTDLHFIDVNNGYACGYTSWGDMGVVMKTADGGQNWDSLYGVIDFNLFVSQLEKLNVVDNNTFLTCMLGNSNKLYRTINGGSSWDTIIVSDVNYIKDFEFTSVDTGHVLSVDGEIFTTLDAGQSWTLEYATDWGLYGPLVYLNSISFVGNTGYTVGSKGLIKKHTSNIGTQIIAESSKEAITLYPNPALNTIRLINKTSDIPFNIYCVSGRKLISGVIQNEIDISNLQQGMYFLELPTEGNELIKFIKQ